MIVLWTIAVAAIIVSSLQLFAYRQAMVGRESTERIQARWAARAGLENTLAVMTRMSEKPDPDDAKSLTREMYFVSSGTLLNSSYDILHHSRGRDLGGPTDENGKFNMNNVNDRGLLLAFDDFTLDVLDAIADWQDTDDEPSTLGVERDYYLSLESPYEPRNGPMRTLGEIEMIAGIWPRYFRGEDWNLNGRLDPNENDSGRSFPPDEADNIMQAGWSEHLTVYSVDGGATDSGQPRIYLKKAEAKELVERLGVNTSQAEALIQYGGNENNRLTDLLINPLQGGASSQPTGQPGQQGQSGQQGQGGQNGQEQGAGGVPPLTNEQLTMVLAECSVSNPKNRVPGKMNLNTVDGDFLRDLFEIMGLDEALADELLYLRDRSTGITSLVELKSIPSITPQDIQAISQRFDVRGNVFTISSRGRSASTGMEVEIVAVVDRSTIPVRILEYREQ
ncbi:MAG TPA: hypothetical protein VMS30_10380 [Phycisphaerales bacterium]|nr:hypothetical protein [Phycisphaerales bacterium]